MTERHVIDPSKELGIDLESDKDGNLPQINSSQMPTDYMAEPASPMDNAVGQENDIPEPQGGKAEDESESEIDSIFDKLDTEKQAAVIKYAKSMVNDIDSQKHEGIKESKGEIDNLVNEIVNSILSDMETDKDRRDGKIRNKKITNNNPYISKR